MEGMLEGSWAVFIWWWWLNVVLSPYLVTNMTNTSRNMNLIEFLCFIDLLQGIALFDVQTVINLNLNWRWDDWDFDVVELIV